MVEDQDALQLADRRQSIGWKKRCTQAGKAAKVPTVIVPSKA
jgi:hypothetical protein